MTGKAVVPHKTKPLSDRQRLFVDEYMKDRNATQAYIRADFSPKGANAGAARLLANVSIKAEIAKRVELYSANAGLSVVDVLERLKAIAWTDIRKLIGPGGAVLRRSSARSSPATRQPERQSSSSFANSTLEASSTGSLATSAQMRHRAMSSLLSLRAGQSFLPEWSRIFATGVRVLQPSPERSPLPRN